MDEATNTRIAKMEADLNQQRQENAKLLTLLTRMTERIDEISQKLENQQ